MEPCFFCFYQILHFSSKLVVSNLSVIGIAVEAKNRHNRKIEAVAK